MWKFINFGMLILSGVLLSSTSDWHTLCDKIIFDIPRYRFSRDERLHPWVNDPLAND